MDLKVAASALLTLMNQQVALASFDVVEIHLYTNDFTPGATTALADFEEANYTGYVFQNAARMGVAYDDGAGQSIIEIAARIFQPTDDAVSNVIFGYYLVGGAASVFDNELIAAARLNAPVTLAGPTDALVVQPRFALGFPIGVPG